MNRKLCFEPYHISSVKFSPLALCAYLKKDGDAIIVDKDLAVKESGDMPLFCIALNSTYGWDYHGGGDDVTIYFENGGQILYGGVYDLENHKKLTRRPVAATARAEQKRLDDQPGSVFSPYIYTDETMVKIESVINETP